MRIILILLLTLGTIMTTHAQSPEQTQTAMFAIGCFWCAQKPYDITEGVLDTLPGYTGGTAETAKYKLVVAGNDHVEVMQVTYNPDQISYEDLLDIFWVNIDPFDDRGQFCDKGPQYRAAIYVQNATERALAEASLRQKEIELGASIVTEIREATPFYVAEDYHIDYYKKNPIRYKFYRTTCGRDGRLKQVWGDQAVYGGQKP